MFKCVSVTKHDCGNETVTLSAVNKSSTNPENVEWSKYTPSGTLTMVITQEGAVDIFKPGKEYSLVFEEQS